MQIAKLRIADDAAGLVPAGAYFQKLATGLQKANTIEADRRRKLDAEDRELEALYRRASASRSNTHVAEAYA